MTAKLLEGCAIAAQIRSELTERVAEFIEQAGVMPCLAAVLVGDDPASEVYVRNKRRGCEQVGLESVLHRLPPDASEEDLLALVTRLNKDVRIHGILVQLPLPASMRAARILDAIHPLKDVDAFHPENVGRLVQGRPRFLPCTPHGVQQLLHRSGVEVAGRHVVVVGRSDIVGKPLAMMLMARDSTLGPTAANATVTVCHSRSRGLAEVTRAADVVVAAVGQPRMIRADMIRPGAVVVDVGINRVAGKLVGDVDFEPVSEVACRVSPVPGGVGPLTVTMLLYNTLAAAEMQLA